MITFPIKKSLAYNIVHDLIRMVALWKKNYTMTVMALKYNQNTQVRG